MRSMICVALVLVLFVVAAASSTIRAGVCGENEPCEDHVTVIGYQNAPRCQGPWYDGAILASNSSSDYDYKIVVVARFENDTNGNSRCDNNQPCSGETCEADVSGTFEVNIGDDETYKVGEQLPVCGGCGSHNCDTGNDPPCTPVADHCTCVIGSYSVSEYSDDNGATWEPLTHLGPHAITEFQSNPLCPSTPACDD